MRELAAVLKKADAMPPLTALKVLGELACMDEHDELEAELRGDVEAIKLSSCENVYSCKSTLATLRQAT